MPTYYFDIDNGRASTTDTEGTEFATRDEVRDAAIAVLPRLARDVVPDEGYEPIRVTVRNDEGRAVFTATLILTAVWLDEGEA